MPRKNLPLIVIYWSTWVNKNWDLHLNLNTTTWLDKLLTCTSPNEWNQMNIHHHTISSENHWKHEASHDPFSAFCACLPYGDGPTNAHHSHRYLHKISVTWVVKYHGLHHHDSEKDKVLCEPWNTTLADKQVHIVKNMP